MDRRSTVAVLLVIVVLLSGCSAFLGGNGDGNGAENGGNGNGASDPSTFDYADGYGPDGVVDGEAAVRSHRSGVIERGSYTGAYTYTIDRTDGSVVTDVKHRVDFQTEEGFQRAEVDSPNVAGVVRVYRDSDTRYERQEINNQTSINSSELSFDARNLTATEPVRPLLENVSEYETSIEEREGETVVVYERTDADGIDSFLVVNETTDVDSFDATMTVDGDGVVRSASYEVVYTTDGGDQRTLTVEYELTAFGETSVDRPAWTDDA
jgi:hypothetical protein